MANSPASMAAASPLRLLPLRATPLSAGVPRPFLSHPLFLNVFNHSSRKKVSSCCLKNPMPIVPPASSQEGGFSDEDNDETEEEYGISPLDLEFMEEEARVAVREYSRSISRELSIGELSSRSLMICFNSIWISLRF